MDIALRNYMTLELRLLGRDRRRIAGGAGAGFSTPVRAQPHHRAGDGEYQG
jgi:hypothetical protein